MPAPHYHLFWVSRPPNRRPLLIQFAIDDGRLQWKSTSAHVCTHFHIHTSASLMNIKNCPPRPNAAGTIIFGAQFSKEKKAESACAERKKVKARPRTMCGSRAKSQSLADSRSVRTSRFFATLLLRPANCMLNADMQSKCN